jgi:hypothetical protein
MISFFGSPYDPRPERKESIIAGMIEFAINNPKRDFTYAFTGTQYYKEALEICKKEKYMKNRKVENLILGAGAGGLGAMCWLKVKQMIISIIFVLKEWINCH